LMFSSDSVVRRPDWAVKLHFHPFLQKTIYTTQKHVLLTCLLHILVLTFKTFWLGFYKVWTKMLC
jgi:hypothetical protein